MRLAQELNGNIAPLFPGSSTAFATYTVLAKVCNKTVHEEPWERCYCGGVLLLPCYSTWINNIEVFLSPNLMKVAILIPVHDHSSVGGGWVGATPHSSLLPP